MTSAFRPGCVSIVDAHALDAHGCTCGAVPDGPFASVHPAALWQFAAHSPECGGRP